MVLNTLCMNGKKEMITIKISKNKNRYVLEFRQGNSSWFMFLDDKVYNDPLQFANFMRGLVSDLNFKSKIY